MPLRTVHAIPADALAEIPTAGSFALHITPFLADGRRVDAINPTDADAQPLNADYDETGATYLPEPRTVTIAGADTTFELLESRSVDGTVLYDFIIRGPAFDAAKIRGIYCPNTAEHPDPLHLWQLIKTYSGRTQPPPASSDPATIRPSALIADNTPTDGDQPAQSPDGDYFTWGAPDTNGAGGLTEAEVDDRIETLVAGFARDADVDVPDSQIPDDIARDSEIPALPDPVTETDAEAGTETETRLWSPRRVAQAITALASPAALPDPVTETDAEDGTETATRLWSPRRVAQAIAALASTIATALTSSDLPTPTEDLVGRVFNTDGSLVVVRRYLQAGHALAVTWTDWEDGDDVTTHWLGQSGLTFRGVHDRASGVSNPQLQDVYATPAGTWWRRTANGWFHFGHPQGWIGGGFDDEAHADGQVTGDGQIAEWAKTVAISSNFAAPAAGHVSYGYEPARASTPPPDDSITPAMLDADTETQQAAFRTRLDTPGTDLDTVDDGAVTTDMLDASAVTAPKLAQGAVRWPNLQTVADDDGHLPIKADASSFEFSRAKIAEKDLDDDLVDSLDTTGKADTNLQNVDQALSATQQGNVQDWLGITAEIDNLASSKADTNLSNVDDDLNTAARAALRAKIGAGTLTIAAYSSTATYSRGSANSVVTHSAGLYAYISGQQRNANHSPDDHPEYWFDLVRGAEALVVGSGSHRYKAGTLAIVDDDVYLATTAISTPRDATWIADHAGAGEEFIHLTAGGTDVEANPSGTDGDDLERIAIDGTNYQIPAGGAGGAGLTGASIGDSIGTYVRSSAFTQNILIATGVPTPSAADGDALLIRYLGTDGITDYTIIPIDQILAVPEPSAQSSSVDAEDPNRNVVRTGWGQNDWIYVGITNTATGGNLTIAFNSSTSLYDSGTYDFRVITYGTVSPGDPANDNTITGNDLEFVVTDIDKPEGTWGFVNPGGWYGEYTRFLISELEAKTVVVAGTEPAEGNSLRLPLNEDDSYYLGLTSGDKIATAATRAVALPSDLKVRAN